MSLQITVLKRKFIFEEKELPEINEKLSAKQVADFYSGQYPELNNATIVGPEIKDGEQVFTFKTVLGQKG